MIIIDYLPVHRYTSQQIPSQQRVARRRAAAVVSLCVVPKAMPFTFDEDGRMVFREPTRAVGSGGGTTREAGAAATGSAVPAVGHSNLAAIMAALDRTPCGGTSLGEDPLIAESGGLQVGRAERGDGRQGMTAGVCSASLQQQQLVGCRPAAGRSEDRTGRDGANSFLAPTARKPFGGCPW